MYRSPSCLGIDCIPFFSAFLDLPRLQPVYNCTIPYPPFRKKFPIYKCLNISELQNGQNLEEVSVSYSIMVLCKAISPLFDWFSAVFFHIGILASLAYLNLVGQELWQVFDYSYKY